MTEETDTKYQIFSGAPEKFNLVPPSNRNIKNILEVPAFSIHKDHNERVYYAMEGEVVPVNRDEEGRLIVELEDVFDFDDYWAHLAERMFVEETGLIDEDGEVVGHMYDDLDRSEVRRAFDDYLGKFAMMPYEVSNLLRRLSASHNIPELTALVVRQVIKQFQELGVSK